jgi:hypothetical protein
VENRAGFVIGLFFGREDRGDMFLRHVGFNELHIVMDQKVEIFITTAMRN